MKTRERPVVDTLVPKIDTTRGMLPGRACALVARTSYYISLKSVTLDLRGSATGFSDLETFGPAGQRKPQE